MKRVAALFFAARGALADPVAELVALPRAAEVVLAVDDRRARPHVDALDVRMDHARAADFSEQVKAPHRRMAGGDAGKFLIGKNSLHLAPEALVEAVARLTERVVGEQKAAEREIAAQNVDLLGRERLEVVFAGHVQKRIA